MKRIKIISVVIFILLIILAGFYINHSDKKLFDIVKADFVEFYPTYQFMECFIGDGDLVVVSVHVKYKKPNDEEIYEEIWKYWDTKSGWLHREKFQDLIRERTKKD